MAARFAIYWVPETDHPLWQAGCAWLGRDPSTDAPGQAPAFAQAPWRYGFHATLKAPFALAEGADAHLLAQAVSRLAATLAPVAMPPLGVTTLGAFVALRPLAPCAGLARLAAACTTQLDRWRRPMDAAEFARRAAGLDPDGLALLRRWGYAHVLERWRFHMTLSDPLAAAPREALRQAAARHFAPLLRAARTLDALCVFEQPAPGQPFVPTQRHRLGRR